MKALLFFFIATIGTTVQAGTLAFEPYVDAQYSCLWIEGKNTVLEFDSNITTVEQASQLAEQQVGQNLTVICNQDHYECVHKDGDVRPGLIYKKSVVKDLRIVGGRIVDSLTKKELAQIGGHFYHQNLRRLPRCKY